MFLMACAIRMPAQDKKLYEDAFGEIQDMLSGRQPLNFKRSVFLYENAYSGGALSYKEYCRRIKGITDSINAFIDARGIRSNPNSGQYAIYSYMMEPSALNGNKQFMYDFTDIFGEKDWQPQFVTKLLRTKQGNCHSLPYLYKILAESMGVEAYLAMAPNHVYIKHKDNEGNWVNVELTNASFPAMHGSLQTAT